MSAKSWKISATPRQRFALSQVLLHKDLKLRRRSLRELNDVRRALGLMGVTEVSLEHQKVSDKYARDNKTRHRFELTAEEADTIVSTLDKLDLPAVNGHMLQGLIDQVETRVDDPSWETALPFDEAAELPRWKPNLLPVVEDPEHFIEVFGELLRRADGDLRRLAELYAEAMAAPPEPAPEEEAARLS